MPPPVSRRMLGVQSPMIPIVNEMVKAHPGTISLGQGIVHYAPPSCVIECAARVIAAESRIHRYGLAQGLDALLGACGAKLEAENGIRIGPDRRIIVTAGSNMAFLNAILAIADVGDEVILLSPFYFNHEMAIEMAGCKAVAVGTDDQYQPRLEAIEAAITPRTRAIVTISPNNPTGAVYPAPTLAAINKLCARRGLYHIADEAYEYFIHADTPHFSPPSLAESEAHTIGLYSFSKAYGMAGWRVGYMLIPAHLEEAIKKAQDTNLICPPILNQLAALSALEAGRGWCQEKIAGISSVREIVLQELSRLADRIIVPTPGGAFYVLVRVNSPRPDMDLVTALIRDHGVAVMPGSTFGIKNGCYLRIAYGALDREQVAQGMGRLVGGLEKLI